MVSKIPPGGLCVSSGIPPSVRVSPSTFTPQLSGPLGKETRPNRNDTFADIMGLIGTVGAGREYTGKADSGVGRKLGALSISPAAHGAKIGAGPTGGPRYARISQATPFGCAPQSPSISPDRRDIQLWALREKRNDAPTDKMGEIRAGGRRQEFTHPIGIWQWPTGAGA